MVNVDSIYSWACLNFDSVCGRFMCNSSLNGEYVCMCHCMCGHYVCNSVLNAEYSRSQQLRHFSHSQLFPV